MKILIITHFYKHKNAMASIRPIKLAKYFSLAGHNVTVLTSLQKDNWCKQELIPMPCDDIQEIYAPSHKGMTYLTKVYDLLKKRGEKKLHKSEQVAKKNIANDTAVKDNSIGIKTKIKQTVSWLFYYLSDRLENHFLANGLIASARKNNLTEYDVVIATYPGAGVHQAGEWFKKNCRTKYFIADYRDPAYNPGGRSSKIELKHDKKVQDRAIKYADGIVCVSYGMAESLQKQYAPISLPPVFVVNNGFDPEDNKGAVSANFNKNKFNFVYTGALYQGRRTVEMLAPILRHLIEEETIDINELAINYAGPDFEELLSQLRPFGLESIAVNFGYVSREQSLGMQEESDIVLLLNWNDDNYTGVIPGKLYEYMATRKPIVALIMGNKSGSESAKMIEDCKIGCACEQASPSDRQKLENYIRLKLSEFKNNERTLSVDSNKINIFEYNNIANKYLDVIDQIINS